MYFLRGGQLKTGLNSHEERNNKKARKSFHLLCPAPERIELIGPLIPQAGSFYPTSHHFLFDRSPFQL
jgi:hypothetical protein